MVLQELSCELYAFECVAGWAMQKGEEEEEEEDDDDDDEFRRRRRRRRRTRSFHATDQSNLFFLEPKCSYTAEPNASLASPLPHTLTRDRDL